MGDIHGRGGVHGVGGISLHPEATFGGNRQGHRRGAGGPPFSFLFSCDLR